MTEKGYKFFLGGGVLLINDNQMVFALFCKEYYCLVELRLLGLSSVVSTSAFLGFFHAFSCRGVYFQWHSHCTLPMVFRHTQSKSIHFIFLKAAMPALIILRKMDQWKDQPFKPLLQIAPPEHLFDKNYMKVNGRMYNTIFTTLPFGQQ